MEKPGLLPTDTQQNECTPRLLMFEFWLKRMVVSVRDSVQMRAVLGAKPEARRLVHCWSHSAPWATDGSRRSDHRGRQGRRHRENPSAHRRGCRSHHVPRANGNINIGGMPHEIFFRGLLFKQWRFGLKPRDSSLF